MALKLHSFESARRAAKLRTCEFSTTRAIKSIAKSRNPMVVIENYSQRLDLERAQQAEDTVMTGIFR